MNQGRFQIEVEAGGFYKDLNRVVALTPKILICVMILWVGIYPTEAGSFLMEMQLWSTQALGAWYIYATAFFMIACLLLAIFPSTGNIKLGVQSDKPEFNTFTWLSMMFGAGIGIGMLTYSTAEPIFHLSQNPDTIRGISSSLNADNVRNAFKWTLLHNGLTAWACYGVVGISLAYMSYKKGLPLSVRSVLQPLFGKYLSGGLGHTIDIVAILATIVGLSVTIGYGVSQFASGLFNITQFDWLVGENSQPTIGAQLLGLLLIIGASCLSAMSGLHKGIKWLSNINMILSLVLILFFMLFGASVFAFKTFFITIYDYLLALPEMSFTVWNSNDSEIIGKLQSWQSSWTIFYWAWWIAFAPFVGIFLARVSKGRTIREYVLGAIIVPSLICLVWFAFIGGTAIDLELSGEAQGSIINTDISNQLFATVNLITSEGFAATLSVIIVILLLTFLITSADSGILIINTLASGGSSDRREVKHIIVWGVIFASLIGTLLFAGGMDALRSVMIIGALPFSIVMVLMGISFLKTCLEDKDY